MALSSRMAQASSFVWLDFDGLHAEGDACVGVLVGSYEGADDDEGDEVGLPDLNGLQAAMLRGRMAMRKAVAMVCFMGYSLKC